MFVNKPQIQIKEAEYLIRQIANAIIKRSSSYNNILFLISFYSNMRNNQSSSSIHEYDNYFFRESISVS